MNIVGGGTVRNCEISGNSGTTIIVLINGSLPVIMENVTISDNTVSRGDLSVSSDTTVNNTLVEDLYGTISLGANNLTGMDPALLALDFADGSSIQVHAFQETSIAFDHVLGGVGDPQCGLEVSTDQLGRTRPLGDRCDAGAFEIQPDTYLADGFEIP